MPDDDRCILSRRGRIELSKYWPDGTRFRRVFPTKPVARQMRARIDAAIAMNTWRDLKAELTEDPKVDLTLQQFSEIFLDYIRTKNRRPDFHEEEAARFLPRVGWMRLKDFTRADAVKLQEWRSGSVTAATVNRMMAVVRHMFNYAEKRGDIPASPMRGFGNFREEERALRVMTIEEERAFLAALLKVDIAVGVYAGVMGEAGLRPGEADRLEWRHLDLEGRILTVDIAKGKRPRYIPISDFLKDLVGMVPRVADDPHVFIRLETLKPVKDARGPFEKAQQATGLTWIHPEDFRHFRATQWVRQGVDLKTVQELLGHANIRTTMRYAHFAPRHAARSIVEAQRAEAQSLRQLMFDYTGPKQDQGLGELERLYALSPTN